MTDELLALCRSEDERDQNRSGIGIGGVPIVGCSLNAVAIPLSHEELIRIIIDHYSKVFPQKDLRFIFKPESFEAIIIMKEEFYK